MLEGELLSVVEVPPDKRVRCQAEGCGHGVFKRIHVVEHDGRVGVYGSECYARLFGAGGRLRPARYGGGEARMLTDAERQMLEQNARDLIERFEQERRDEIQRQALQEEKQRRTLAELKKRYKATPPDCPAGVLDAAVAEAKALVRQRHNVDPELPGFVGLVRIYAQQIIKQRKGA